MTRSWNLFMYSLSEWTIKVHRLAHERWEPAWGLCQHRWRLLCSYPVVDILLSVPHWDPLIKHWKNISSFRAKDKTNQRCFGRKSTLSNLNIIMFNNAQCFSAFCQYIVSVTIIHPEVVSLKFWIVPLIYWIFPRSQLFFFLIADICIVAFIGFKGQKRWCSSLRLEKVFALSRSLFCCPSGRAGHFERL